ncbi:hypothetical protein SAY86_013981 [Trapa natans]|uniref:Uncharacterized protein n=1 Tax=Trapa natans TaxID=22666 RepID=A0AAN7KZQ6_TRANT|nr:hypothetical protein SAY86_013981 [Trapa natans]
MADGRKVHPDCPNAGNPYHICVEDCYLKIANGKPHKSSKSSGQRVGRKEIVQGVPKEKRMNSSCPKLANPYHECSDECFQNGSQADPRKQTAEAPVSRRKNRQPNSQTNALVTSAADDPKPELNGKTPISPPLMHSGEIQPAGFSFNKEQVRSSYSSPLASGNATPVLGFLSDQHEFEDHLGESLALVASSKGAEADKEANKRNHYFSGELVPRKATDSNNNDQVSQEGVRGSMISSISENNQSFRDSEDDDEDDDVQSVVSEVRIPVGKYHVKSSISSVLQAVLEKYGDIAENCRLESTAMRSYYLECVCFVVQELQSMSFMNMTKSKVKEMQSIVKDLESALIEVGWLREILVELSEVTETFSQHQTVKATKMKSDQAVESARRVLESKAKALADKEQEVVGLKVRVAEAEGRLRELEAEAARLDGTVGSINSQIESLRFRSLLQELV